MNKSPGYKELLKKAKELNIKTIDDLHELATRECSSQVTGADYEEVKKALKINRFS